MKKTCLLLDETQAVELEALAKKQGRPIVDLLREGLSREPPAISKKKFAGPFPRRFNIALTDEQVEILEELARARGITKSDAIRKIFHSQIQRYTKREGRIDHA